MVIHVLYYTHWSLHVALICCWSSCPGPVALGETQAMDVMVDFGIAGRFSVGIWDMGCGDSDIENGPVEIGSFPMKNGWIFHRFLLTFTRGYHVGGDTRLGLLSNVFNGGRGWHVVSGTASQGTEPTEPGFILRILSAWWFQTFLFSMSYMG